MKTKAFRAALPYTLPICVGFLFLGMSYGFFMRSQGFSFVYPLFMSLFIFAGSMEFVTANLLLLPTFQPVHAFLLTIMVNARHLFYGLSLLDKFKNLGWKKPYLIFGLCDETFSIHCTVDTPEGVDPGWFMFFVTVLNQAYWVAGATAGALLGYIIHFNTKGIEFVMTALFVGGQRGPPPRRHRRCRDDALPAGAGQRPLPAARHGAHRGLLPLSAPPDPREKSPV